VFHFGDPFRSYFANGGSALQPASFVVGQMTRYLEIEPTGRSGFVAVRFVARGAYLFFHRPLCEVAAGVVDLDEIWCRRAREWTERIALAPTMGARLRLVETLLLGLLRENGRTDPAVDRGLEIIEASGGQIRVARLAAELGVSCRHLTRQFQRAVGVSPKEFVRVSRFLRAVKALDQGRHGSLTEVALACGFFDQAHFNHEFRELAGMSPGQLATFPNISF
jgi:AraC-like DNA-binding protein